MDRLVEIEAGKLRGRRERDVDVFRAIPYAQPPVGDLRFLPPRPVRPWTGTLDCLEPGAIPPQASMGPMDPLVGSTGRVQSEDCLSLNVWTPACDDARRPVLLWLYGGSFIGGCSGGSWTEGASLARRDAVVVSCNYRVGLLGFFNLGPFLGDRYATSANVGILDQIAVLEWVRDNIEAFGGDPDRVTVFGQSAGAGCAADLLVAPAARGLFHRVVLQSGGPHLVNTPEESERLAARVLREVGIDEGDAGAVRDVPVEALLDVQDRVGEQWFAEYMATTSPRWAMPIQPTTDGMVLPSSIPDAVVAGSPDVQVMGGWNIHENRLVGPYLYPNGVDEAELVRRATTLFGGVDQGRHAVAMYRAAQPEASALDLLVTMDMGRTVAMPTVRLAEWHPGPSYLYRFTVDGTDVTGGFGAVHGMEVPFVFDTLDAPGVDGLVGTVTDEARRLADIMSSAWVSFAATGRPSHPAIGEWPTYDPDRRAVVDFGIPPRVVDDPDGDQRALWDSAL